MPKKSMQINLDQLALEVRIERAQHNELESKRIIGKKNYFPYESSKLITIVKLLRKK